ncbi:DNA-binding protein RFX2 isoform X1 [Lutzomyia longipalpis]|uniref:DNA-binding protein RFX2 isoform X1 n=1 Tax=Lutzomyia longipalpis TaxID=7200 RepID=UPI0024833CDB|nr:DNA-binding protein RFX2 isoform X1 [Lutzomyia longipalpis]
MAARLATQRNFVAVTSVSSQGGNVSPASQSVTMTSPSSSNGDSAIAVTTAATSPGTNGTPIPIALHQVLPQKIILQTTTTPGGVSVIDVVPLEHSDSSNESPITVVAADAVESTNGTAVVAPGAQQVTAQVAVVQTHSPNDSGPHYITVTAEGAVRSYAPLTTVVSSQDNVASHGAYHVQYVDSELYTTTGQGQTQMAYPVYAVGDYGTGGQQYYATATGNYSTSGTTASNHSSSDYIVPVDETILSTNQTRASPQTIAAEVAYIQGQTNSQASTVSSETENTPSLSHATRVSPATVAWLVENYETAEGVSLPRSTLYNHYMRHCNENKLDAVNAASFGKLIRSVFTGLRTRRLGTRGNSKYHYYGIRVKPGSTLMSALDEKPLNNNSSQTNSTGQAAGTRNAKKLGAKPETYEACSQYLGDGSAAIPVFPAIDTTFNFPEEVTFEDVDTLRSIYREHCEAFLDAVLNLEFSTVESLWREFWRVQDNNNGDECEEEKYLSKSKLYILCQCEPVQMFIKQVDFAFYQNMVDVLIPDVLRPIPSSLTQAIRNFAKNLESWLSAAMSECPDSILQIKLSAVSAFSQTLRRYTSLNHLAQAARAVLQNSSQIAQMLNDLNRVDFHNVQEQASWVCQCDTATVQRLENDFKAALQQQNTLEQWASWLRLVVDSALEEYRGKPTFAKAARQFLLKWSFYSSMVIRDLTLRSAASFGSFHLIRLLYDEYMFFIVEHKVAQATQTTPIAVMSEVDRQPEDIGMVFPANYDCKAEPEAKRMRS